jgi:hypothetical protein
LIIMAKRKKKAKEPESEGPSYYPRCERSAFIIAAHVSDHIERRGGRYLRDEDGSLHLILNGKRIALKNDPENYALNGLLLDACGITAVTQVAKATIQRIQVKANEQASSISLRKFSALSEDRNRLYVPVHGAKLLAITAEGISEIDNGKNPDSVWVEHPDQTPFGYSSSDPAVGLLHLERLVVETQACLQPEMRWFVAMQEGFFPYVRELCPSRFITVHIGPSQQGKTTGAEKFTILHGLGCVKGDYSVPALAGLGDIGLLVLDNKEQSNFSQGLIDFCLYLATGAERGRARKDGTLRRGVSRPVAVITTIEGVYKAELQNRCVEVQYRLTGPAIARDGIEREIREHRNEISSAMIPVLQRFLQIRSELRPTPNPIPNFSEHFCALCDLLRAYEQIAGKPAGWSERIILAWERTLRQKEAEEEELEHPILRVFRESNLIELGYWSEAQISWHGRPGRLLYGGCSPLLGALQQLNLHDCKLPRTGEALGRRLRSGNFRAFKVLDEQSAPELAMLKRTAEQRGPVGIFFGDDSMTAAPHASVRAVIPQPSVN